MTTMRPRPPQTVDTVKTGLVNLHKGLSQLTLELAAIRKRISPIAQKIPQGRPYVPPEWAGTSNSWRANRGETDEPLRATNDELLDLEHLSNLDPPTRILLALARDIEGALLDIRATRTAIEAIQNDSDLRADFKDFMAKNR
jgi:hypothetical protein